jgi:hypothetical protein
MRHRGNRTVHWKDLSPQARELLAKLLEGRPYELTDHSLTELEECRLIELNAGGWQPTPAGRSAYVIRDPRPPCIRARRSKPSNLGRRLTCVQQP